MPKTAVVKYATLRNALVNLPLSLYAPLLEKGIAPQALVVELTWKNGKATLGWTGMPAKVAGFQRQTSLEAIEIDSQFAQELNLGEGQTVSIDLRQSIAIAKRIDITPQTADDWEILETNAEYVESNMLAQVRAVAQSQTLCVWAGKSKTMLRFRLDSVEPANARSARLTNDTEVVIAPKSRKVLSNRAASSTLKESKEKSGESWQVPLLRLLPAELLNLCAISTPAAGENLAISVNPILFQTLQRIFPTGRCAITIENRLPEKPDESGNETKRRRRRQSNATADYRADHRVPISHVVASQTVLDLLGVKNDLEAGYEVVSLSAPIEKKAKSTVNGTSSPAETSDGGLSSPQTRRSLHINSDSKTQRDDIKTLAGVEKSLSIGKSLIRAALAAWRPGIAAPGVIVTGTQGSGKTSFIKELAKSVKTDLDCRAGVLYNDCSAYTEERPQAMKDIFKAWVDEACWRSPVCLVLDNLDRMLSAEMEHVDTFRVAHLASLFVSIFQAAARDRPIILIASVQNTASYHALLRESHIFGKMIALRPPDKEARKNILQGILSSKLVDSPHVQVKIDFAQVAADTEGYLPADLRNLVDRAMIQMLSAQSANNSLTTDSFQHAQTDFVPLSLRSIKLQTSTVRWSDIGGLRETRQTLRETLEWPTKYAAIFAQSPLRLRSGLLLYGYPGCGKTLLASAVAKECGLNFISIKGPELLNKYIGASEQSVRDLFERAQAAKPCVLFFDEFDSIAPRRGHDSTGVTDRVVNQMLTQMDGAEGLDGVYVLAATSRPDLIDPALLRPGRLDKSLLCDMPSATDRLEIMQACTHKIDIDQSIELETFAETTNGYSGADLQALIYNAHLEAVHDSISTNSEIKQDANDTELVYSQESRDGSISSTAAEQKAYEDKLRRMLANGKRETDKTLPGKQQIKPSSKIIVQQSHLDRAMEMTRPSVSATEVKRLQKIYNDFVAKRSTEGLPSGEASNEVGGRVSLM